MKFKHLLIAAVAALSTAIPAQARIERGTADMLNVISKGGINVHFNTNDCDEYDINGAYITVGYGRGIKRDLILCVGDYMDANDHSTARHEVAHVLQHCVNQRRGTHRDTPIIQDSKQLAELVNKYVSAEQVVFIKSNYPRNKWMVEFEANYVENVLTSKELIKLWNALKCEEVFDE